VEPEGRKSTSAMAATQSMPALQAMQRSVDLKRFMGSWYVVGHVPVRLVKEHTAHNAVETYTWDEAEQRIGVHYRFNENALDGPINDSYQRGWVHSQGPFSEWRVSPQLPCLGYCLSRWLKLPYIIVDCASDYSTSIIGYPNRDYLWILSRNAQLSDGEYQSLVRKSKDLGYDEHLIRRVPHDSTTTTFPVPDV